MSPDVQEMHILSNSIKDEIKLHGIISLVYSAIKSDDQFLDIDSAEPPILSGGFALLHFKEPRGNSIRFFICVDESFIWLMKRYNCSGFERSIIVTYADRRKFFDGFETEKWFSGREGNEAIIVKEASEEHRIFIPQLPFPVYNGINPVSFYNCMRAILGYRKEYSVSEVKLLLMRELRPFMLAMEVDELLRLIENYVEQGIKSHLFVGDRGKYKLNGKAFRSDSITAKYYYGYLERSMKKSLYDF